LISMRTVKLEHREKINEIIKSCKICFVAMTCNDTPYVLPMNFALDGDSVILHSAQNGRMWETLHKNPRVCISWATGDELAWQNERVGCSYTIKSKSVLVEGIVEFVDDFEEKERCLNLFMTQYSKLEFKFNAPAVKNVGIMKVNIETLSAKEFGASAKPA
jgi:uncharacterized protein